MKTKAQLTTWTIFVIFVLCLSLINVNTVLADDAPPTEPPAATEAATEPPTEAPTQIPESTPPPAEGDLTGDMPITDEEAAVAELLSEIPDNTDVVILDENGNPVPLASQAAADIIEEEDPLWCPVGAPLNSPLCRNFTGGSAITNMLTDMRNNTGTYDENGVIYFTSTAGGSLALTNVASSLSTDFALLSTFNLTLTGGWNGSTGSPSFSGQTSFGSNTLTIGTVANPWGGNLTLNNFVFSNVNDTPGVQIYTTNGSVTLNNVDLSNTDDATSINVAVTGTGSVNLTGVDIGNGTDGNGITITTNSGSITLADVDVTNQQDGYTANLLSQSGNISVTNGTSNGSSFDSGNNGLGFVATTNTGSITMTGASGSGNQITFTDAEGNGATLSAPTVTLTQVTANNNDLNGIQISNANAITLNNVIATNNGTEVTGPDLGSGVRIFGTGTTTVNVTGGTYSNNERYGIEMSNVSSITTSGVTMSGNGEGNIVNDSTAPTISPTFSCNLPGNAGWCRGTITINWNIVDTQSAVNTSGCQTSFNSNTSPAGTALSCSATSTGGTTNSSVLVRRDGTAPNTNAVRSPGANGQGWNNTDVTVTFNGSDAHSGIASCTAPVTITSDGSNQPATGSCSDVAGNTDTETINVNIDRTAPTVTANLIPAPNGNGWNNSGVLIIFSGNDPGGSGVPLLGGCSPLLGGSSSEGANQAASSTCTDRAGNSATGTVFLNIDLTNPVATATKNPLPNANGWNNSDVVVTFTGTDVPSGIDFCTPAATVSTEGSNQSRSGTCTDLAGRVSNTATANGINIDKTPPVITFVSRTPANGNGWNSGNVTVNWSCSDSRSGVVSAAVSQTVSTEGANQSATGTCVDRAGNTSSNTQNGINIDWTNPTLNLPANITQEATGPSGATVNYSASASDNLDANPTFGCAPASGTTYPLGTTTVGCTATDAAGNSSSGSFTITVQDTTAPVIAPHADITAEATSASGSVVTYTSPSTSDVVDGAGTASCLPASGSTFPLGNTTVTCNASDTHENAATPTTFVVHVVDTTAPVIAAHADITEEATSAAGNVVTYTSPATSDAVDGPGIASCLPDSGSTFPVGNTTVTCSASDTHGNVSVSTSFVVHIVDTTPPTISPQPTDIYVDTSDNSGTAVSYFIPQTFDIVDGIGNATCTPSSGSNFPLFDTVVTCSAVDAHGNSAEPVTFTIHVTKRIVSITGFSGFFIPETGGSSVKINCAAPNSFNIRMAGARIIFNNLCDYQAFINHLQQRELPGELPNGFEFIDGYTLNISKNGNPVNPLPEDASVAIEFNIPNGQEGADFGVLYWNGSEWTEIAGAVKEDGHFVIDVTAALANSNTFIFVTK